MRDKYTIEEFGHIKNLVICALTSQTKADAQKYIRQLDYIACDVGGYSRGVLAEVKSATIAASGRVRDKERLTEMAHWYLNKLEMLCVEVGIE